MYILEQLTLSSGGVSTEQNIDLPSESASATLGELFGDSSEQLTQNALLYVVILPNARGKGIDKLLVKERVLREGLELFNLSFRVEDLVVFLQLLVLNTSESLLIDIHVLLILLREAFIFSVHSESL